MKHELTFLTSSEYSHNLTAITMITPKQQIAAMANMIKTKHIIRFFSINFLSSLSSLLSIFKLFVFQNRKKKKKHTVKYQRDVTGRTESATGVKCLV